MAALTDADPVQAARACCVALLARREYCRGELLHKLMAAGVAQEVARKAVEELAGEGAQSDARYAESLVRSRHGRGYGPQRMRLELATQGLSAEAVEQALAGYDWSEALAAVHAKKFGRRRPATPREWAARVRFLTYRGFESSAVSALLRRLGGDDFSQEDD
jgi:regulatory protein